MKDITRRVVLHVHHDAGRRRRLAQRSERPSLKTSLQRPPSSVSRHRGVRASSSHSVKRRAPTRQPMHRRQKTKAPSPQHRHLLHRDCSLRPRTRPPLPCDALRPLPSPSLVMHGVLATAPLVIPVLVTTARDSSPYTFLSLRVKLPFTSPASPPPPATTVVARKGWQLSSVALPGGRHLHQPTDTEAAPLDTALALSGAGSPATASPLPTRGPAVCHPHHPTRHQGRRANRETPPFSPPHPRAR